MKWFKEAFAKEWHRQVCTEIQLFRRHQDKVLLREASSKRHGSFQTQPRQKKHVAVLAILFRIDINKIFFTHQVLFNFFQKTTLKKSGENFCKLIPKSKQTTGNYLTYIVEHVLQDGDPPFGISSTMKRSVQCQICTRSNAVTYLTWACSAVCWQVLPTLSGVGSSPPAREWGCCSGPRCSSRAPWRSTNKEEQTMNKKIEQKTAVRYGTPHNENLNTNITVAGSTL